MQHNYDWRNLIGQENPRTRSQLSPLWQVVQNNEKQWPPCARLNERNRVSRKFPGTNVLVRKIRCLQRRYKFQNSKDSLEYDWFVHWWVTREIQQVYLTNIHLHQPVPDVDSGLKNKKSRDTVFPMKMYASVCNIMIKSHGELFKSQANEFENLRLFWLFCSVVETAKCVFQ